VPVEAAKALQRPHVPPCLLRECPWELALWQFGFRAQPAPPALQQQAPQPPQQELPAQAPQALRLSAESEV
jgi:hypothetical protein